MHGLAYTEHGTQGHEAFNLHTGTGEADSMADEMIPILTALTDPRFEFHQIRDDALHTWLPDVTIFIFSRDKRLP